ncbi:glycosyltransferase [Alkalihalobacterium chitinilyticum]|uniref:Glycosyltransferase n=1 Tax=Alkalihalobacterium chitinilyticum TaxID=2980103 RepID=A0ABT5VE98_9BACI|nr:glycosyltransferase [Alkalihalobacterium chitinilyticum]MDE5413795.1 glycosyltransferase [Alkalihalobacterium chitinilyticum]
MKQNILFVMPSLSAGGGEKSLVNLLTQIDYELYDVELFLFKREGLFLNMLPEEVQVLDFPKEYKIFSKGLFTSFITFMKERQFSLAFYRIMFTVKSRLIKDNKNAEQQTWKYLNMYFNTTHKEYDVAIGFLEKTSIYYVVDRIKSTKKIGWIHTNYSNSGMNKDIDHPYYEKLDRIVTVSQECAKSISEIFPDFKDKVDVIFNIVSPKIIDKLSKENMDMVMDDKFVNIVTMGRLSYEKGIDMAVNACDLLVKNGFNIKWYVLGEGDEKENLEELIKKKKLGNNFFLLGLKENPYPYIKNADIYVQPSRYEGKSIAIDEAKILKKPIVVTNYNSAKDQIANRVTGIIEELNATSVAEGIQLLIENEEIRKRLINNLHAEQLGTEGEIEKLYDLIRR